MEKKFKYFEGEWFIENLEDKMIPSMPGYYCIKAEDDRMDFGAPIATTFITDVVREGMEGSVSILSYAKDMYELLEYINSKNLIKEDELLQKRITNTLNGIHSMSRLNNSKSFMDTKMTEFASLIRECNGIDSETLQTIVMNTESVTKEFKESMGDDCNSYYNYTGFDIMGDMNIELNYYPITDKVVLVDMRED